MYVRHKTFKTEGYVTKEHGRYLHFTRTYDPRGKFPIGEEGFDCNENFEVIEVPFTPGSIVKFGGMTGTIVVPRAGDAHVRVQTDNYGIIYVKREHLTMVKRVTGPDERVEKEVSNSCLCGVCYSCTGRKINTASASIAKAIDAKILDNLYKGTGLKQVSYSKAPRPVAPVISISRRDIMGLVIEGWIESRRDMDGQYSRCRRCHAEARPSKQSSAIIKHLADCRVAEVIAALEKPRDIS